MPSVQENLQQWNHRYQWRPDGEDWSLGWGSSEMQWYAFHLPRLYSVLPTETVLEIATGRGRWTQYLRNWCDRLIGIDLAPQCIDACRDRFQDDTRLEFHVNDGKTIPFVADDSVDLVFSFDSLVHVEIDVMDSYLHEIKRVLRPNGVAYLHHSNLAEYEEVTKLLQSNPQMRGLLKNAGLLNSGWRGLSVSAERVKQIARNNGLSIMSQELLDWGNESNAFLIDCLTTLTVEGSQFARPEKTWRNQRYMEMVKYHQRLFELYGRPVRTKE